jgi:glycosyltransferase involved in cell wall biosynthesis
MALGKPVVATRIEGYSAVITDEQEGLMVPPRDAKSLAQALKRLILDESLRRTGRQGVGNRAAL